MAQGVAGKASLKPKQGSRIQTLSDGCILPTFVDVPDVACVACVADDGAGN